LQNYNFLGYFSIFAPIFRQTASFFTTTFNFYSVFFSQRTYFNSKIAIFHQKPNNCKNTPYKPSFNHYSNTIKPPCPHSKTQQKATVLADKI